MKSIIKTQIIPLVIIFTIQIYALVTTFEKTYGDANADIGFSVQ